MRSKVIAAQQIRGTNNFRLFLECDHKIRIHCWRNMLPESIKCTQCFGPEFGRTSQDRATLDIARAEAKAVREGPKPRKHLPGREALMARGFFGGQVEEIASNVG